jgi:hypothetical protein
MEQVMKIFKMNEDDFIKGCESSNEFIKTKFQSNWFPYMRNLDQTCDEYLDFGADKCCFKNLQKFCDEIDIDESMIEMTHLPTQYHYYTKDRKVTFTIFQQGNYVHYFGMTGEKSEVLRIFEIFCNCSTYSGLCWGGRDYI